VKPYYQDDAVTIYHGDCREILPQLEPVDLVLTDPPYPTYLTEQYHYDDTILSRLSVFPLWAIFWTPGALFPLAYDACHVWDKKVGTNTQFEMIYIRGRQAGHKILRHYIINSTVAESFTGDVYTGHPSQKPIRLISELIMEFAADSILDPFMGSGTTLRAAKDLGRKAIGIEIEEKYCEIAAKRMAQEVLQF